MRQKYYVCMDYGLDETGKRVKKYKTYPTLAQARRGLRDFQTEQDTHQTVAPRSMTLDQWLEYWMEEVIQPNRAATTIYGYRKIIDNHLSDALGSVPIQKLTPQHLQQYYSMLMRDKGLSANTVRGTTICSPAPCTWRSGRTSFSAVPQSGWSRPGSSPMRPDSTPRRNSSGCSAWWRATGWS